MLFRLRELIRNLLIRFFMGKKNNLEKIADRSFSPDGYTHSYIVNSTIIIKYQKAQDVRFFRECRRHRTLRESIIQGVDIYFSQISDCSQSLQLKDAVLADLQNKRNYRNITRISTIFEKDLMDILSGAYRNYEAAGVPCFSSLDQQEEFIAFIKYICGVINGHKINAYLPTGTYENYSANKLLATYRFASVLGVGSLIVPIKVVAFWDNGHEHLGTMTKNAPGYPPSDITPQQRRNMDIASFLKDITNLEYLDALCYQLDHRLDNYYVVEDEEGKIARVVTFDNDAARTFFISSSLPKATYAGCSCVLTKNGTVARPYMDQNFAQALRSCTKQLLKKELGQWLSGFQLHCLWKRIRQLQKAVEKTAAQNPEFLVTDWNTINAQKAEDPSFGCTYYSLYLTDTLMLDRKKLFEEMKNQN